MSLFSELIVRGRSVFQMNSAAETATGGVPDGTLRLYNDGTNSFIQVYSLATGTWDTFNPSALVAPSSADYLVGTANGSLSAEIVAGTAPGGELGGTWGSPTVDTVHAEGGHSAMIATHTADGDAHHAEAHTHTHASTTGKTANDHHAQSHTVVSHSDTSATGAELNTLTDGSTTTLHNHAAGWTLAGSQTTEGTTQSVTEADVISVTGLSIAVGVPIMVLCQSSFTADGGGTRQGNLGLEINTTSVVTADDIAYSVGAGLTRSGTIACFIPPRQTNYLRGDFHATGTAVRDLPWDADGPNATITGITIRGLVSDVNAILRADNLLVYTLAT
jgi:hypothetical protein